MTLDSVTQASDQNPEWSETEGGTVSRLATLARDYSPERRAQR